MRSTLRFFRPQERIKHLSTPETVSTDRPQSRPSLTRNALSNVGTPLIYLAIGLFLSPYLVHTLGNARYGAWSLVAEMLGYYNLLDFGMRTAVIYFAGHYAAKGEYERLRSAMCSAFWALAVIGVLLSLAGSAFALRFSGVFIKGQASTSEVVIAMSILSFAIGLGLPVDMFGSVLIGNRRLDLYNGTEAFGRILSSLAIYLFLRSGGGLIGMAIIQFAARFLTGALNYLLAGKITGGLPLGWRWFAWQELRSMAKLGYLNALLSLSVLVIMRTDLIVVGMFLGVKWVAFYSFGRMLVTQAAELSSSLSRAFAPQFIHAAARNEHAELNRLFLFGTRISATMAAMMAASLAAFGYCFLRLWVGPAYVSGDWTYRSDIVMAILLAAQLARWLQNVTWQLMITTRQHHFATPLSICEALVNLGLSILLVKRYGLAGVAIGTLIPMLISNLLSGAYALRMLKIGVIEYFRKGIGSPLAAGIIAFVSARLLIAWWTPLSWRVFFTQTLLCAAFEAVLCAFLCFTQPERKMVTERVLALVRQPA